jgi:HTH-type transcriptional regulator/antitoxin HigA
MPCRLAVDDIARGVRKLSMTIRSFSSSDQRRRRPVSTTSHRQREHSQRRPRRVQHRRQQVSHRGVDQLSLSRRLCPVYRYAPAVRRDRCTNRLKVEVMDISPIKSQRDYRKVLKEIEGLMIAKRNTPEGDRLDVLVTLVEAWERKHYPMDLPDPVEAIKYHMDQNGLQPRDLIPFIGSRNRVHEVLNRRRSLTLKMIWRLHEGLGIPAESLIKVGQEQAA